MENIKSRGRNTFLQNLNVISSLCFLQNGSPTGSLYHQTRRSIIQPFPQYKGRKNVKILPIELDKNAANISLVKKNHAILTTIFFHEFSFHFILDVAHFLQ